MTDDVSGYPGAPPGLYADPAGGPGQRWWDGYAWTAATVLPAIPPPPPTAYHQWPPRPPDADVVNREVAMTRTARIAVAFFGVNTLVTLLNLQLRRSQFRAMGHNLRVIYDASRNGRPVPPLSSHFLGFPLALRWLMGRNLHPGMYFTPCMLHVCPVYAIRSLVAVPGSCPRNILR